MTKNTAVNYGILAGVGAVAYFLLFYFINKRLMLSPAVNWGSVAIFILFMVLACRRQGDLQEAFGFKEALRTAFLTYLVADVIYYVFYYVLHGMVDPELAVIQQEMMLETTERLGEMLGSDVLEEDIGKLSREDLEIRPGGLLLSLSWSLIGGFIISLIIAIFTKR